MTDDAQSKNYKLPDNGSTTLTINRMTVPVTWDVPDLAYDGTEKKVGAKYKDIDGTEHDLEVATEDGSKFINAGDYTLVATFMLKDTGSYNYQLEDEGKTTLTIEASGIEVFWNYDKPLVYNGTEQTVGAYYKDSNGNPVNLKVTVDEGKQLVNVGTYTLRASFAEGETDYVLGKGVTQDVEVVKKPVTVNWGNTKLEYTGEVQTVTVSYTNAIGVDIPLDIMVTDVSGQLLEVGEYNVVAQFSSIDAYSDNYELTGDLNTKVTIDKKTIDIDWSSTSLEYNGAEQTITAKYTDVNGKKQELNVTVEDGRALKNAGEYTLVASFKAMDKGSANYQLPEDATKLVTIEKKVVDVQWSQTALTYNGAEQEVTATYINAEGKEVKLETAITSGGSKLKDAGDYTLKATLVNDGVQNINYTLGNDQTLKLTIGKKKIAMPKSKTMEVSYTGDPWYATDIAKTEGVKVEGDGLTDPGKYTVYVSLADDGVNTMWEDGTTATIDLAVTVILKIDKPTEDLTSYVYNGNIQVYTVVRQDKWKQLAYSVRDNMRTDAGSYTVTVSLTYPDYIRWNVGDTQEQKADLTFTFTIAKAENKISNLKLDDWTYGTTPNSPTCSVKYGTVVYTYAASLNGQYSETVPTRAGSYYVKAETEASENFTADSATAVFNIKKVHVEKPKGDDTVFTYNGEQQTYNIETSRYYTISDNTQTEINTYEVTVALNDTENYEWSDASTDELTYTFTINGNDNDYLWLLLILAAILMIEIAVAWIYTVLRDRRGGSSKK
jgi:hypothetical protein